MRRIVLLLLALCTILSEALCANTHFTSKDMVTDRFFEALSLCRDLHTTPKDIQNCEVTQTRHIFGLLKEIQIYFNDTEQFWVKRLEKVERYNDEFEKLNPHLDKTVANQAFHAWLMEIDPVFEKELAVGLYKLATFRMCLNATEQGDFPVTEQNLENGLVCLKTHWFGFSH